MSAPTIIEPKPLSRNEMEEIAERIRRRVRRAAEDIIAVGQDLITVKAQLGHGRFLEWIDREFGMTDRTARKYMQVTAWAEGKSESVSDLPVSTLYLLAAPSAPPEVADDVIAQAEAGESLKTADVKRQIEEAQTETAPAAEQSAEPKPPPEGKSLWFDLLEVRNVGPCREGLPSMYVVRRGEQEIKRGGWDASLAQVRKLIDEPLPPGRLTETRLDSALPRPSLTREQRFSGPRCL